LLYRCGQCGLPPDPDRASRRARPERVLMEIRRWRWRRRWSVGSTSRKRAPCSPAQIRFPFDAVRGHCRRVYATLHRGKAIHPAQDPSAPSISRASVAWGKVRLSDLNMERSRTEPPAWRDWVIKRLAVFDRQSTWPLGHWLERRISPVSSRG
jgi:hypothetical protein